METIFFMKIDKHSYEIATKEKKNKKKKTTTKFWRRN